MKKIVFALLLFFSLHALQAQEASPDTSYWKYGGMGSLSFSQVSLSNWAAGGEESYAISGLLNLHAEYNKGKVSWENNLDMAYGIIKQGSSGKRKSDDKIDFSSKAGYKASKYWFYTAMLNFRTQFDAGYEFNDDDTKDLISDIMAPAYLLYSAGMDFKPSDKFSAFISPATGKTTIVQNQALSDAGAFGVEAGQTSRTELGGYVKFNYKEMIFKNVSLNTKLDLFSNYLNKPENIDVNWEVLLSMKVNKFLTANLSTQLIYDDDIDMVKMGEATSPKVQFKEVLGIGLSYQF